MEREEDGGMSIASKSDIDISNLEILNFSSVLSQFDEGVIIVDKNGIIVFYNETQAKIDDLSAPEAIGQHIIDIYNVDENNSKTLQCLNTGLPIKNELCFYRTRFGKVANTIHSVFPLFHEQKVIGAICYVKDYKLLENVFTTASRKKSQPNGQNENGTKYCFTDIVGADDAFLQAINIARLAANSPSPVMICGETGTGKEMFAQSIHNYSPRNNQRFVAINCAAIPEHLLEGLLFGTTKGSFTNAVDKAGIFEQANGGTLFLDEVNSMPINLQSKLLRVLQEREIRRVGGTTDIPIDLKIISSINSDNPYHSIQQGDLRMDLFYRLCVVSIHIPPLRKLKKGLELLIHHFIDKNNLIMSKKIEGVSDIVMHFFRNHHWPGNTRELAHIIEGAMNMVDYNKKYIDELDLPSHFTVNYLKYTLGNNKTSKSIVKSNTLFEEEIYHQKSGKSLKEHFKLNNETETASLPQSHQSLEKNMIHNALKKTHGNVSVAALELGISRQLLHYKMKKYALNRNDYKPSQTF